MTCIEPYPTAKITELADQGRIRLCAKEVQDVEIKTFRDLEENDLLFIDSSHVAKVDSDVNWLYLEVLPNLKTGVVIHIHDISFPYLTFMPEHPLFEHSLLWNEAALLKAFMMYNEVFGVLMCQSYLHYECPEAIKNMVSCYDARRHFPASLWLVKKK
jgi:Methyltransferase domain